MSNYSQVHLQFTLSRAIYIFVESENLQIPTGKTLSLHKIAVCSFSLKDYGYVVFLLKFYRHCKIVIEEMCMIKIEMLETNWQATNE